MECLGIRWWMQEELVDRVPMKCVMDVLRDLPVKG